MMRVFHTFDPYIVQIYGDFGLRWYSLPYVIGFLLAYRGLVKAGERGVEGGLSREGADRFLLYAMIGVIAGARFFHVFVFEFGHYGVDPLAWVAVWRGGLSFHGGLVGAVAAIALFARREGVPFYAITDRLAVPVAIALGLGRIGNFINGEMPGTPYDGLLCIDYSQNPHLAHRPVGCRHPTQLYEMAKNWGIAGFLILAGQRPLPRGVLTWGFIGLYGAVRFFLMFVRDEARVWAGLTLSQVFSGVMAVVAAAALAHLAARSRSWAGATRR